MNKLNDEILNRYVDGELSLSEIQEVMKIINESEPDKERYLVLLKIHQDLKNLQEEKTSMSFTSHLMDKVKARYSSKKKDKHFILSIASVFVLIILMLLGYVFDITINNASLAGGKSSLINNFVEFAHSVSVDLIDVFSKSNFTIIGTVISILMLGIAYVFYENLRTIRHGLGKSEH
jgi:anti-sigma factor RsiW